jgi:hypothetical protein
MTPYSTDGVVSYLDAAHALIKKEHEWAEMVRWVTRTLDGSTGKVTQLITNTKNWKSIRRVYHDSMQTPLALLSSYTNPSTSTLLFGYRGLAPEDDNTVGDGRYLVNFYPVTLTGTVLFQIDREIDWSDEDAVVPIDFWLHVFYACWMWACDDGTNPVQVDKYAKLMRTRMQQVTASEASRPSFTQPNQLIPNDWWEQDAPYS